MDTLFAALKALGSAITAALAVFYYNWAIIFASWGQSHRAFWYMNRAVRMSPNNAKIYYRRGGLFLAMGQPERAIQDYDEAIRLDPQHIDAYRSRSLMYTLIGRNEEAQRDLDQAVRLGADRAHLEREAGELRKRR